MSEPKTELIQKTESTEAFRAVLTIGKQFSDQIQEARDAQDEVAEAMLTSFGMVALQKAMTEHPQAWDVIERSCGNKWGFRTDRDTQSKGYDKSTVIAVYCEALLNKLKPIGNEFNVISSGLYVTKEGWKGKLERLPGVTLVDCRAEVFTDPEVREFQTKEGYTKYKMTATIGATASCEVWGRPVSVEARLIDGRDERIQVSAMSEFADQVIDQLKGKIDARMYERLYEKVKTLAKLGPTTDSVAAQPVAHVEMKKSGTMRVTQKPTGEELPASGATVADDDQEQKDAVIRRRVSREGKHGRVAKILEKSPDQMAEFQSIWDEILSVKTMLNLDAIADSLKQPDIPYSTFSNDVKGIVKWLWSDKKKELAERLADET